MAHAVPSRSREPDIVLWTLPGSIWASCPRCEGPAQVRPPRNRWRPGGEVAVLSCADCGLVKREGEGPFGAAARKAEIARWSPRCDRCGRPAVRGPARAPIRHGATMLVRSRCAGCNHVSLFPARPAFHALREGHDPYFDLPLFLVEPVGRELLWVWNRAHAELLAEWLGASLRERSRIPYHWSMVSRLPRWMKQASMREPVMRALDRLRDRALAAGLS